MDKYDTIWHILITMRTSTLSRIDRLEVITARLKSDEPITIGEIAKEVGVSIRTLNRDIEVLRSRGLPIETDVGRGGGIRLDQRWGVGRVNLNYTEAVDLMISLAIAEQMKSPLFMAHLSSIRHKVMASFSSSMKSKVNGIKARIIIGKSASEVVLSNFLTPKRKTVEKLHQAFLMLQRIKITYCDESGKETLRTIEPHYLFLSYPVWYILAWDKLREDIRVFRCDRIRKIQALNEDFKLIPLIKFKNKRDKIPPS
ncbi:helix-turn-helix transcriptional regulator [Microbulbifer sp. JMSA004]|uniref:helix-turn-helix transcriptional regulator n=1 Tax=unclassified Microbulbifer TaxID=2619833 RepID=UPI0024AD2A36|nr:WYL domain-containing protein [Microbulbifer sp. VAAF005]WHI48382.1 WYL domain-containing protein [Microbulbifer sp. VAAF005]